MQRMKFGALDLAVIDPHQRDTQYIYDEIFVERQYDHPAFKLPAASTIFDVGANIGLFSIWAHQVHRPRTIHAFEASPLTFAYLQDNVARHVDAATTHERTVNAAVASEAGKKLTLHQSPLISGISTLLDQTQVPWVKSLSESHEIIKHQVRTTTLSEEIRLQHIEAIDLLKIDVEGFYMEVLRGLADADFAKVRNAVIEIEYPDATGAGPDEVDRLMRSKGFKTDPREQALYAWR